MPHRVFHGVQPIGFSITKSNAKEGVMWATIMADPIAFDAGMPVSARCVRPRLRFDFAVLPRDSDVVLNTNRCQPGFEQQVEHDETVIAIHPPALAGKKLPVLRFRANGRAGSKLHGPVWLRVVVKTDVPNEIEPQSSTANSSASASARSAAGTVAPCEAMPVFLSSATHSFPSCVSFTVLMLPPVLQRKCAHAHALRFVGLSDVVGRRLVSALGEQVVSGCECVDVVVL